MIRCWNGDETLPVEKHRWITLQDLLAPEFYSEERQLTFVYKDQSSLQAAALASVYNCAYNHI